MVRSERTLRNRASVWSKQGNAGSNNQKNIFIANSAAHHHGIVMPAACFENRRNAWLLARCSFSGLRCRLSQTVTTLSDLWVK